MESPSIPRLVINPSGQPDSSKQASVLLAGDFYLRPDHSPQSANELFAPAIIQLIRQSDFSAVNFEGTLGGKQTILKEGPCLALNAGAPTLLKAAGFSAITLANNHAMDYGAEGLSRTLQACRDIGLQCAGAGLNLDEAVKPLKTGLGNGARLQVLSFCEREFGVTTGKSPGTAWLTSPHAESLVQQAKQESDVVIVCAHGGNELMPLPSPQRRRQLQSLIDAGADLIIGHHPHVPQAWEQYGAGYIFYSLGNFYFDSTDGSRYRSRDWSFMVRVLLSEHQVKTVEVIPYERVQDKLMSLGSERNAASHLAYLEKLSSIVCGHDFEGYWQELAVNRLSEYRYYLGMGRAHTDLSLVQQVKESFRSARDQFHRWRTASAPPQYSLTDRLKWHRRKRALGALNVIRCDSHRWALETALAVLGGECTDLRTAEIKQQLRTMMSLVDPETARNTKSQTTF